MKNEEKTEAVLSLINGLERYKEMSRVEDLIEQNPEDGEKILSYISNPVKTQLVSGINCTPETANEEMLLVKNQYNKLSGRQFIHFVQSFSPEENVTPEKAHEIGQKLAKFEGFKGFQMVIATHIDTQHSHNHFVINTVNADTGIKWHKSRQDMQRLKEYSDEICREYGLSVIPWKNQDRKPPGEYRANERGDSWKNELRLVVKECLRNSINRTEFLINMSRLGYKVNWIDTRKYITFTTPEGMKCRNIKLGHEFDKEKMLKRFELNQRYCNHQEIREAMDYLVKVVEPPTRTNGNYIYKGQSQNSMFSWKDELSLAIKECLWLSINRTEFVTNMSRLGYKVNWTDTRKYITFTTPEGMKCRNVRLGHEFDKEKMLKQLEFNNKNGDHQDLRETMESLVKVLKRSELEKNSWRDELRLAVKGCLGNSTTEEEFTTTMRRLGYEVNWEDRSIFFKTPVGKKCRSESLGKRYEKANLLKTIEDNKENIDRRIAHARMELVLEVMNFLSHRNSQDDNRKRYPLSAALEGQALKDKITEEQFSSGLDWDKGAGYER